MAEHGAVVEGQKKPRARLEASNHPEASRGGKAGLPATHGGDTCLSCVPGPRPDPSGCSQNPPPSSGQPHELQAGSGDQGSALPPAQAGGEGTPKRCPSWLGSPPWHPRLLSFSPPAWHALCPRLPTSSDSRPSTKCPSPPLPSRASTHLTWLPRTA